MSCLLSLLVDFGHGSGAPLELRALLSLFLIILPRLLCLKALMLAACPGGMDHPE